MPMEVERADLVVVRGRETISREEFLDAYEAAIHLPGFRPGDPILFDLTEHSKSREPTRTVTATTSGSTTWNEKAARRC